MTNIYLIDMIVHENDKKIKQSLVSGGMHDLRVHFSLGKYYIVVNLNVVKSWIVCVGLLHL